MGAAIREYERPADENAPDHAVDCGDQPRTFIALGQRVEVLDARLLTHSTALALAPALLEEFDRQMDRRPEMGMCRHVTGALISGLVGRVAISRIARDTDRPCRAAPTGCHRHHPRPRGRLWSSRSIIVETALWIVVNRRARQVASSARRHQLRRSRHRPALSSSASGHRDRDSPRRGSAHVGAAIRAYERPADENAPDRAVDCGYQPRPSTSAAHRGPRSAAAHTLHS